MRLLFWKFKTIIEKYRIKLEDRFLPDCHDKDCILSDFSKSYLGDHQIRENIITFILFSNEQSAALTLSLKSLLQQSDPNWLCMIVTEIDSDNFDSGFLEDVRIRIYSIRKESNEKFPIQSIISQIESKYFIQINPGDIMHPQFAKILKGFQGEIIYYDHYIIPNKNNKSALFLKPQWSPELWLSVDILYGAVYSVAFVKQMIEQYNDDWLARSILNAKNIVQIPQALITSTAFPWQNTQFVESHIKNVKDYFVNQDITMPRIEYRSNGSLKFEWSFPTYPKVSILIPNRDQPFILRRCIESIYKNTNYPDYEIIIIDDQSQSTKTIDLYSEMISIKKNFHVVQGKHPFNFSRACNQGAKEAKGDYLLLLNNDTEVFDSEWLKNMVDVATLPGVGAVGAKLLYPDGRIQHAGVVIGLEGHASHVFQGVYDDPFTPYGHVDWMRNVSAVTAACMLTPKNVFWKVGGFDEQFQIAFGDIDYCLRLNDADYRIVYTPDACLIHYEGKSRGDYIPTHDISAKAEYFLQKVDQGDPYYHPNLSRAWRIPTFRRKWEQDPAERLEKIIEYFGDKKF